jgi:CBS-domain-containing membrane protein
MLTARDLMTQSPAVIDVTATLRSAVDKLQTLEIRHLPVVDSEGELVGMVSDRDLRALSIPYFVDGENVGTLRTALDASVASIMSADVIAVDEEADAAEIVDLMLDNRIGAVPVVDGDRTLVGIVSYVDVLRALPLDTAAE